MNPAPAGSREFSLVLKIATMNTDRHRFQVVAASVLICVSSVLICGWNEVGTIDLARVCHFVCRRNRVEALARTDAAEICRSCISDSVAA